MKQTVLYILVLILCGTSKNAKASQGFGIDLGSSFSPHGYGLHYYNSLLADMILEVGTGYSKDFVAGIPISLGIAAFREKILLGTTIYRWKGQANIGFRKISNVPIEYGDYVITSVKADWQIIYLRLGTRFYYLDSNNTNRN